EDRGASLRMTVVLSILKWIGIVLGWFLLGLLALALLILLVVLFVPFRYRASVATDETGEKKVLYGFGVSWIAHAISVKKALDSDKIVIRVLGIPVKKLGGAEAAEPDEDVWDEELYDEDDDEDVETAHAEDTAGGGVDAAHAEATDGNDVETAHVETAAEDGADDARVSAANVSGSTDDMSETVIEEFEDFSEEENKKAKKDRKKRKTDVESQTIETEEKEHLSPPARLAKAVRDKIEGIKKKIRDTFKKFHFIFYKLSSIIDFVKDRASRQTVKKLIKELIAAIRYVGPKKISGTLEFGTGDPGSTGMILSGVSLCKLAYKKDVSIRPNFEEKCLSGDCTVKGRVRVVYFVRMGLRIWFNKDVHHLWRRYRRMKKDFKKQESALGLDS
ncbi:MAG: DUF2953 domain-containing protein, partial [Eubacterium sp.]|nr:DUF2953 domain-containing protein [Eubacterium sp.]